MNNLAKEINELLLNDKSIQEYLSLKHEIESDSKLKELYLKLDNLRKEICKDKTKNSDEYYLLLNLYKSDNRVKRYEILKKEVQDFLTEISDILSLK